MSGLRIEKADNLYKYSLCIYLRTIVYVIEQNVPPYPNEFNPNEDKAMHYIGWLGDEPVATARYRILEEDNTTGKIERIVVVNDRRKNGFGTQIVKHVMDEMLSTNPQVQRIIMNAQDQALPFYEKLGYSVVGDGFIEAGIPHHRIEFIRKT